MTRPGKVVTTDREIDAAIERGRTYDRHATKIVRAEYDREHDQILAVLSTGATITVPRRTLPRLEVYQPDDLGSVQIESPGYGLWFDKPDIGIRIECLLRATAGEGLIRSIAAQALGSAKSDKKAKAARKNGTEGGRPRTRPAMAASKGQPGLDGRQRDADGEIHRKSGDTRVGTLRDTYGDDFAGGHRSDTKLGTLLDRTGSTSLSDYTKKRK